MDNLEKTLLNALFLRLTDKEDDEPLYTGFSGGCDSVVLLHALCRLRDRGDFSCRLCAIHVHHAISPNAGDWADFCKAFCAAHEVDLEIVRVKVPRHTGEGLEAAARQARYAAFADCGVRWLALAHHRDDQAETVLLNLLRGAGVAGAAGMPEERDYAGMRLLRPLLDVSRAAIEAYAEQHGLSWVNDESNEDAHYRRNFLRHQIMPALEDKFPGAVGSLARAAGYFAESHQLLDILAAEDFLRLSKVAGTLSLSGVNALPEIRARNLLRWFLRENGFRAPQARWLEECLSQLKCASSDAEICLSGADGELHVYRDQIYLLASSSDKNCLPAGAVLWRREDVIDWAGGRIRFVAVTGEGLSCQKLLSGEVVIRPRQGGEKLRLDLKRPRRSLKNVFQEMAIPPWERVRLPYLWCGETLAWVGDVGYDVEFLCAPDEAGIELFWEAGQPDSGLSEA